MNGTRVQIVRSLYGQGAGYFVLMSFAVVLSVVQTWIFARVLEPDDLGLFATVATVASFGGLIQLGILSGLTRELPIAIGGGYLARADALVRTSTSVMLSISVIGLPLFLLVVFLYPWDTIDFRTASILSGVWVSVRLFAELAMLRLRSEGATIIFPVIVVAQRLVTVIIGGLVADQHGFAGLITVFLGSDLLTYLGLTIFYLRRVGFGLPEISDVRYLVSIGLPQALAGTLRFAQLSGEKLFIFWRAGSTTVGIYQIAWWPLGAAITINGVINQFLAPKLLREFGEHDSTETVFNDTVRVTALLLAIGAVLAVPALLLVRPLVDSLLPAYANAVPAMRIFIIGGVLSVANLSHIAILAANRADILFKLQLVTSTLTLSAYAVVTSLTISLNWIATVSLGGIILDFIVRMVVARQLSSRAN